MSNLSIVDTHWLDVNRGRVLHHAALPPAELAEIEDRGYVLAVLLSCGRSAQRADIAGLWARWYLNRCAGCCKATGLPRGKGAPKDSEDCRAVLGLDT